MKKFEIEFACENKWKGNFKMFNILPALNFTIDTQFKGYDIGDRRINGFNEYGVYLDIFVWSMAIIVTVEHE